MTYRYFYAIKGHQSGPVPLEELKQLALNGVLNRHDKVWHKGMKEWREAGSVPEVFEDLPPDLDATEEALADMVSTRDKASTEAEDSSNALVSDAPSPPQQECGYCGRISVGNEERCPQCGMREFVTKKSHPVSGRSELGASQVAPGTGKELQHFLAVIGTGLVLIVCTVISWDSLCVLMRSDNSQPVLVRAKAAPAQQTGRPQSQQSSEQEICINWLRQLDGAKQQWALENRKADSDSPSWADVSEYLPKPPECPAGGTYTLNAVDRNPTCSIPGHKLWSADQHESAQPSTQTAEDSAQLERQKHEKARALFQDLTERQGKGEIVPNSDINKAMRAMIETLRDLRIKERIGTPDGEEFKHEIESSTMPESRKEALLLHWILLDLNLDQDFEREIKRYPLERRAAIRLNHYNDMAISKARYGYK